MSDQLDNFFIGNNQGMRWYIVQTYVGFEDVVKKMIEQKVSNLGLQKKVKEVYIPTKKVIKLNSKNERKEKEEKVYPGYIYVNMSLDKEVGYLIQNTQYVSKIAGTGNVAIPLDEGYVEKMKTDLAESEATKQTKGKSTYQLGDLVKITEGPFKDMQGKISGIDPDGARVNVLLTIFDRETDVELDVLEVKKVVE